MLGQGVSSRRAEACASARERSPAAGPLVSMVTGEAPMLGASGRRGSRVNGRTRPWLILVSLLGCTQFDVETPCNVSFTLRHTLDSSA